MGQTRRNEEWEVHIGYFYKLEYLNTQTNQLIYQGYKTSCKIFSGLKSLRYKGHNPYMTYQKIQYLLKEKVRGSPVVPV